MKYLIADNEIRCGDCRHYRPSYCPVRLGSTRYDCICEAGKYTCAHYRGCLSFEPKEDVNE